MPAVTTTPITTPHDRLVVTDLEVVTVTPTSVVISWITRAPYRLRGVPAPFPSDTRLELGSPDAPLALVHDDPEPRAFHVVEVRGLEPGRTYRFRATSNGRPASPGLRPTSRPGTDERRSEFTTLVPPPGRYLTTVALVNDIHIGERRQGIVLGALPTSVQPGGSQSGYAELMFAAALSDLRDRYGSPLLMVNGDLTYDNAPEQVRRARTMLDAYGTQRSDWVATRGNHDHPRRHADPFGEAFIGYQQAQKVSEASGLRVLAMDSTRGSGGGWMLPGQYEQIMAELTADPERPTIACTHHPVTTDAGRSSVAGPQFMLRAADRLRLQTLEGDAPGVFLHHAGHTHRMRRDRGDLPGSRTQYVENAACAAYPGGYAVVHLYQGGYILNFWRSTCPDALDWLYRSRWQMLGIGPHFMLGSTADRNHVVTCDLSGLVPSGREQPAELRV